MTYLSKWSRLHPHMALAMALVVVSCSSSSSSGSSGSAPDGGGETSGDCKAGKNAAFATPAGAAFTLPAGVQLAGEMTGDVDPNCGSKSFVEYGGDFLPVSVGLKNASTAEVTVTFPAGLTFLAKDPTSQNGIILQSHDVTVAAGETTYLYFRLFCINQHCVFGRKEDRYTFGNVSNDTKIAELITLARPKKLKAGSDISAALVYGVWDVTDGDGLTQEHRAAIEKAN